mgnify:CR=1 FL=1
MKKTTVLITGGAGYIGSHANCFLSEKGYDTIVLDNLVYGHKDFVRWGVFVEGDISDSNLLDEIFRSYKVDAVMHFAAYAYVGESVADPAKYYENNVVGTLKLLDSMRRAGVDKFIFSSSCATYGVPEGIPITEDMPQKPINPYGRTKLYIEQAAKDYGVAYGLKSVMLRYFNAAGADPEGRIGERHAPETHLIPLVILSALNQDRTVSVFGDDYDTPDGTCVRDYIHVNDLASAHCLALEHLLQGGESDQFNLGNGQGFSVREILECTESIAGSVKYEISDRRPGDPPYLVGSSGKIRSKLGWNPEYTDIEQIITHAWQWHSKEAARA